MTADHHARKSQQPRVRQGGVHGVWAFTQPANVSFSHVPRALLHALFTLGGPFAARRRSSASSFSRPLGYLHVNSVSSRVQPLHQFGAVPTRAAPASLSRLEDPGTCACQERKRYGGREKGGETEEGDGGGERWDGGWGGRRSSEGFGVSILCILS